MSNSEWTNDVLKTLFDIVIHERDARYQQQFAALMALHEQQRLADLRFEAERDRRYTEVAAANAVALKVKEEADKIALGLQRDNQIYKDEKANELREQISSERGLYVTKSELKAMADKIDATIAPVLIYVSSQQGRGVGADSTIKYMISGLGALLTILVISGIIYAAFQVGG